MNLIVVFGFSVGGRIVTIIASEGEVNGDLEVVNWEEILEEHKKTDV